jgi:hypothetical protein
LPAISACINVAIHSTVTGEGNLINQIFSKVSRRSSTLFIDCILFRRTLFLLLPGITGSYFLSFPAQLFYVLNGRFNVANPHSKKNCE